MTKTKTKTGKISYMPPPLDLKKRILADSLGLVVVVFVQNFESSEKCKLQGHIQQTSKKLQKQRACYYYY